ncbi:MAG: type II secretion system F family protein [Planctomycetes bacterium]|nr:type II secretion system F family protein [Planctomycetota bacterium]
MPTYWYIAKDENGNKLSGTYSDVSGVSQLREELTKIGYSLVKARKEKAARRRTTRVSQREIVAFTFKFSGMYSAGLSVLKCLETLEQQSENHALRQILGEVRQSVETGTSLKKAFEPHEEIFSSFFLGMIEAGETGGQLIKSLEMSAVYLEKRLELKEKVKAAFVYPAVVCVVCMLVITGLIIFVVPMFSQIYGRMNVALPGPTLFLIVLSEIATKWWPLVVGGIAALVFIVKRALREPNIRATVDRLKLSLPVFGRLNRMVVVARFVRTFATLVSVGVPLLEALDGARLVVDNVQMSGIIDDMKESIRTGGSVAKSFRAHAIFPPVVVQLADSGEEAGVLPEMLNKGAEFLDKDIDRTVQSLLVKLEPTLTLGMGSLIGVILLGVYLPMFDYMNHIK